MRWAMRSETSDGICWITSPDSWSTMLTMASFDGALKDSRIRQALQKSIDYTGITTGLLQGTAVPAAAVLGPAYWGYAQDTFEAGYAALPQAEQDVDGAKIKPVGFVGVFGFGGGAEVNGLELAPMGGVFRVAGGELVVGAGLGHESGAFFLIRFVAREQILVAGGFEQHLAIGGVEFEKLLEKLAGAGVIAFGLHDTHFGEQKRGEIGGRQFVAGLDADAGDHFLRFVGETVVVENAGGFQRARHVEGGGLVHGGEIGEQRELRLVAVHVKIA